MKNLSRNLTVLTAAFVFGLSGLAVADGYDLAVRNSKLLQNFSGAPASNDKIPVWDNSADEWMLGDATTMILTGNATPAEIDSVADDSARVNTLTADTAITCATHGTGQLNYLSAASGTNNITMTLPAATGTGCGYYFAWMVAPGSGAGLTGDVIQVTGDDSFNGAFWMAQDGGNTSVVFETSADTDKLTFTSTQGAAQAGPFIHVIDVAADKWQIKENSLIGTGTEATPGATGQRS